MISCKGCFFYKALDATQQQEPIEPVGECHVNPPTVIAIPNGAGAFFPAVKEDCFCGEHRTIAERGESRE